MVLEVGQEGGRNTGENLRVVGRLHLEWERGRSGLPLPPTPAPYGRVPGSALGALGQPSLGPGTLRTVQPRPAGGALPSCSAQPVRRASVLRPPGMIICSVRSESRLQASSFYSWVFTPPAPAVPVPPHATCHAPLPTRPPTPPSPVGSSPSVPASLERGDSWSPSSA